MARMKSALKYLGLEPAQPQVIDEPVLVEVEHDEVGTEPETVEPTAEVTPLDRHRRTPQVVPAVKEETMSRIATVHTSTFEDARFVGENFRDGAPVILDISSMDDNEGQRVIDYSVGLAHGLGGKLERITSTVYLVCPEGMEASDNVHAPRDTDEEKTKTQETATFFSSM